MHYEWIMKKTNSNKPLMLLNMAYTYMESCVSQMASPVWHYESPIGIINWSLAIFICMCPYKYNNLRQTSVSPSQHYYTIHCEVNELQVTIIQCSTTFKTFTEISLYSCRIIINDNVTIPEIALLWTLTS